MPFAHGPVLMYQGAGRYRTVGETAYVGSEQVITINAEFLTDLASVPRLFWILLPPSGAYENAAVLHDWLCVQLGRERGVQLLAARMDGTGMYVPEDVDHVRYSRVAPVNARDADGLFRRVMREAGVGPLTRWLMWTGVRWGALLNPARRAGWWRDAPLVIGISALVLTPIAAAAVALWRLTR